MSRRAAALGVLLAAALATLAVACGTSSHPYQAELYEVARSCIDPVTAIDVVGDDTGNQGCAAVCLVGSSDLAGNDAGPQIYVSTMCAPYPKLFDRTGANAACAPALAALARTDICLPDGGSTAPVDAGFDAID